MLLICIDIYICINVGFGDRSQLYQWKNRYQRNKPSETMAIGKNIALIQTVGRTKLRLKMLPNPLE